MTVAITPTIVHSFERARGVFKAIPIYYITHPDQLPELCAWAEAYQCLLVDVETDGSTKDGLDWMSKKIATIQIGSPAGSDPRAYVLCVRSLERYGSDVLRPLLNLFEDPEIVWLGQNIRFELLFLGYKYGVEFRRVACTQIAEMLIRAGLFPLKKGNSEDGSREDYKETSMKMLCKRHLDIDIDKGEDVRLTFWTTPAGRLTKRHLVYAAGDVLYPFWVALEQKQEIYDRGLRTTAELEFDLIPIIAESQMAGIGLDQGSWLKLAEDAEILLAEAGERLDQLLLGTAVQADLFGRAARSGPKERPTITVGGKIKEVNYNSAEHAKRVIANYCKMIRWPIEVVTSKTRLNQLKRKFGADWLDRHPDKTVEDVPEWFLPEDEHVVVLTADAKQLWIQRVRGQLPATLIEPYLDYKEAAKRSGTYGREFLRHVDPRTGRIHTEWHQLVATGRMSSAPNLQNITKLFVDGICQYRKCFTPRPGWKFVLYDFSQIEPRISAEVSDDPLYCTTFKEKRDLYTSIGESMGKQAIDRKTEVGAMLRQGFKVVVLAVAYVAGARTLRDQLTLNLDKFILSGKIEAPTYEYAKQQLDNYYRAAPGIKAFQEAAIAQADPSNPAAPRIWDKYVGDFVTYTTAVCGRKRFFRPDATHVYTQAPNVSPQGGSATITKLAVILLKRECDARNIPCYVVGYQHDELIAETPEEHAETVSKLMKDAMETAGRRYIKKVPVIAEAHGTGVWDYWRKDQ